MTNTLTIFHKTDHKLEVLSLFLLTISFIFTDWIIYLFSVSDFIIVFLILLLLYQRYTLKYQDLISYIFIEGFILVNSIVNLFFNENFSIKIAGTNFVKVVIYHTFIVLMYKYIQKKNLKKTLLIYLNITAMCTILIGIYITIVLITENDLPYEFLWTFTRSDRMSYMFRGSNTLVRTRSVFSEPAHLGYYLNTILSLNLFSEIRNKVLSWSSGFIILGVFITFSYSSIGVLGIVLLIKFMQLIKEHSLKEISNKLILVVAFLTILIIMFRELLYESVLVRTKDIIDGTDGSYVYRIFYTWKYINGENVFLGNGLGHTPPIQNIYAYMLSDLGILAFIGSLIGSLFLVISNSGLGLTFVAHNFQKGGYLSSMFWLYLLLLFVYTNIAQDFSTFRLTNKFNIFKI